jgi:UDP-N-acetylmuramyl tripeptide synthase
VDRNTISRAICEFQATADILPGSFNDFPDGDYRVIVDGIAPSWHLRQLLRSANPGNRRRQITVLGDLERLPDGDVREVGRLLGRHRGAIILHSNKDPQLFESLRRGISANDFPPVVIHLPTERRALNRALKTAKSGDLVLILTGPDPGPSIRAIHRQSAPS